MGEQRGRVKESSESHQGVIEGRARLDRELLVALGVRLEDGAVRLGRLRLVRVRVRVRVRRCP